MKGSVTNPRNSKWGSLAPWMDPTYPDHKCGEQTHLRFLCRATKEPSKMSISIYVPKLGSKIGFPVSIQTHPWAHLVPARVGLFTVQATDWRRLADGFADHSSSTLLRLGPDLDGRQGGIVFCSKLPWQFHTFFYKGPSETLYLLIWGAGGIEPSVAIEPIKCDTYV